MKATTLSGLKVQPGVHLVGATIFLLCSVIENTAYNYSWLKNIKPGKVLSLQIGKMTTDHTQLFINLCVNCSLKSKFDWT